MSRERTRYFAGQVIGVADLEQEQLYLQEYTRVRETCAVQIVDRLPTHGALVILAEVVLRQGPSIGTIGHAHRRRVAV